MMMMMMMIPTTTATISIILITTPLTAGNGQGLLGRLHAPLLHCPPGPLPCGTRGLSQRPRSTPGGGASSPRGGGSVERPSHPCLQALEARQAFPRS
jgi:hypothetical protein